MCTWRNILLAKKSEPAHKYTKGKRRGKNINDSAGTEQCEREKQKRKKSDCFDFCSSAFIRVCVSVHFFDACIKKQFSYLLCAIQRHQAM